MDANEICRAIAAGQTYMGIELGSTRIKAVLIGQDHVPLASGSFAWENRLENGLWTYALEDVWAGLQACYAQLCTDVLQRYGITLERIGAMGISGMMHGYIALDREGNLLTSFRTWRNTITGAASEQLTALFGFPIPQRWTVAHLYQAMLNHETHVAQIARVTTLAGYVHWRLSGTWAVGAGEASGIFPIDRSTMDYNEKMLAQFDQVAAQHGVPWHLRQLLPQVLTAGDPAGSLTPSGALLLDPSGKLQAGVPLCPPEGDAGTGMVATNSVRPYTGNVSAGTSIFAMVVLKSPLSKVYPQIDMVTTPDGVPVAMVHCNNGTTDLDAWVKLFKEAAEAFGAHPDTDTLYRTLYGLALDGAADAGGLTVCNYYSGEHVTGFGSGRPLLARAPEAEFTLPNLMRAHLYAVLGTLRTGMDILYDQEKVTLESVSGHGGFFKVPLVGQRVVAAALKTPVTVMQTAGEGGPWGMAILAAYSRQKQPGEALADYLDQRVFAHSPGQTLSPLPDDVVGFNRFMERFQAGLDVERTAVNVL